jgi:hypothetical protein
MYGKTKTIAIGAQLLGVLSYPMISSLVIDSIELALKINSCEEIKNAIQQKSFNSI